MILIIMTKFHLKSRGLLCISLLTAVLTIISCSSTPVSQESKPAAVYTYKIINVYPHDRNAFTEGLVFENGNMYEGTGQLGRSSLRRVKLETGEVLQARQLSDKDFGEGITIYGDKIIQLTWQSGKGFIYDKNSFKLLNEFSYSTEGWGITTDGKRLIMSDGSSNLYFLDPETFKVTGSIKVHYNDNPVSGINELEYVNGRIYANIWYTDRIAIIDPGNGRVTGWIDLTGLLASQGYNGPADILNGIAYDAKSDRLFVTGKYWPLLFEIKVVGKER